ncbi:MAG: hypothetical protein J6T94_12085 [Bacteroidaceae bacterium]|nr:hypothetical protein [Bacteroidaceae bacterium]
MKRFYLTLFLCLQAIFLMAQTDSTIVRIDLDTCSIGDVLTPHVQSYVKKLILSGRMQNEDYPFVNDCRKLTVLDMTNVLTDSIPQYSLVKDKPLTDIYLPKKKILFNANSVKNKNHNDIAIHVTGVFPSLDGDYSSDYDDYFDLWQLRFTVEKGNEHCVEPEKGVIFSADRDTLYRFAPIKYNDTYSDPWGAYKEWWDPNSPIPSGTIVYFEREHWDYPEFWGYSISMAEVLKISINYFDVKVVATHAFAFCRLRGDFYFSSKLETICRRAFQGILPCLETTSSESYASYACNFHLSENPPRLEDPMFYSWKEVPIIYVPNVQAMHKYLETSCAWAGTGLCSDGYSYWEQYNYLLSINRVNIPLAGGKMSYIIPHVVHNEWYNGAFSIDDIVFKADETDSTITTEIEIGNSSYFRFIIYWRDIIADEYPWSCHYEEHFDTVYSPITDWEDLIYEIEIVDDNGNECFSAKRKRGDGNTEHLSGTLSNVPTSEQGELKSRTNGRRYGSSPWYTQRINFDGTGIRPLKPSSQSNTLFDLQGRQVTTPSKGIYVKEGKKVLVK